MTMPLLFCAVVMLTILITNAALAAPTATPPSTSQSKDQITTSEVPYSCDPKKMRYYPEEAQRIGKAGFSVVQCLIRDDGKMQDCKSLSETPGGYGFGAKAAELATCFYHTKLEPDGKALGAGTLFTKRVDFNLQ